MLLYCESESLNKFFLGSQTINFIFCYYKLHV